MPMTTPSSPAGLENHTIDGGGTNVCYGAGGTNRLDNCAIDYG
jgi:hypothetical protein